jgi:catechol 2,3-dioxygenase-like lactoylglutathione lyase family enzyme
MTIVDAGRFHRLAFGVADAAAAAAWCEQVLGTTPVVGMGQGEDDRAVNDVDGADTRMQWLGGMPLLLLGAADTAGPVAAFIERYGPSVHSLAWEIDDMWSLEHRLTEREIRITGVNVPGRHFFMHPRDTRGLLIEWTDTHITGDWRDGDPVPVQGTGAVEVTGIAWVTGVVEDVEESAAFLTELTGATTVGDNPPGNDRLEHTRDVRIGDLTVRLVSPRSDESSFAATLSRGPRWHSAALRVAHLDDALAALEGAGVKVLDQTGATAWTEPADTHGIALEWTDATA